MTKINFTGPRALVKQTRERKAKLKKKPATDTEEKEFFPLEDIRDYGINIKDLSERLGRDQMTVYRWLNSGIPGFMVNETNLIISEMKYEKACELMASLTSEQRIRIFKSLHSL